MRKGRLMLSEPQSIFFQTELKWAPIEEWTVNTTVVRGLYNKMFEPGGYTYDNLTLQSEKPTLSRRSESGQSICQFGADSITLEESHDCHLETFVEVVETVLGGLNEEDIPPFFLQRVRIQCLAQPANCENAVELLAGRAARVYENIQPFERPPSFFGMRFRFPPAQLFRGDAAELGAGKVTEEELKRALADGRIEEKAGFITLRFESYARDPHKVWMEVAANYPQSDERLTVAHIPPIVGNIRESYKFLTTNGKRFLDQFDTQHEGEQNE